MFCSIFSIIGFCFRKLQRFVKGIFSPTELLNKRGKKLKEVKFSDEENAFEGGLFFAVIFVIIMILSVG